ncbi:MAG: ABC transporter permease [Nitrospirae bacterium]|nr:MAG: ABC transporter permease [Nitrospirota bacterium]
MKRALYVLREAVTGFRLHRANSMIGIVTTAFTLASFGLFGLTYLNVRNVARMLQQDLQVVVYLQDDISDADRERLEQQLRNDEQVAALTYVSKAQALAEFRQQFPEESRLLEGIGPNPLPASFVITLASSERPSADLADFGERVTEFSGVEYVRYNRDWIEHLTLIIRYFELGAVGMGIVLGLASATIIANTVSLAFYARKDEVEILRLIGATGLFIALPYIIEGAMLGAMGSGVALGLLWSGFEVLRARLADSVWLSDVRSLLKFFPAQVSIMLIIAGMMLGALASFLSVHRWMKVRV